MSLIFFFVSTLEEIAPNSILFTAVPKSKIDFVREIVTEWVEDTDLEVSSIESLIKLSKTEVEFLKNLDLLLVASIRQTEKCTRSQFCIENDICQSKHLGFEISKRQRH